VEILAVAAGAAGHAVGLAAEGEATGGLTINFFWVIVSALNFAVFLAVIWIFAFRPVSGMLRERRERIEQGLKDAEQALGQDASEANYLRLCDVKSRLSRVEGTEALIEGFGASSGRSVRSL